MTTSDYERHAGLLRGAQDACRTREAWSPFEESPSRSRHPEGALEAGRAAFEARLGAPFEICGAATAEAWIGEETSPYTGEPLGVTYPQLAVDALMRGAERAWPAWRSAHPTTRVGVCLEILQRLAGQVFENAFATMHTSGQAFMMAFAGSGANSLDRGLEGIAFADLAMSAIPDEALYERQFGRRPIARLRKRYRLMPRGIAVVITCGSYPAWNAYPALFANLATGNPVIVKPHPAGILPMALAVDTARRALAERGFDPDLVQLCVDRAAAPIAKELAVHPSTAIVDFTGSQSFGTWIEQHARGALVFTETAGCNGVVLESTHDLDATLDAIAEGIALFSSQMCTAPQNVFVPSRVRTDEGVLDAHEIGGRLAVMLDRIADDPQRSAAICGALNKVQTQVDLERMTAVTEPDDLIRGWSRYTHPEYPNARTATPLLIRSSAEATHYRREHFGPIAFVIECESGDHALRRATEDARQCGAIASYAYSADESFLERVEDEFAAAGASVGCNLVQQRPINFTAAYSDYHVTGLNPAGNACLTDISFVASRFRIVQSKTELPTQES